MATVILGDNVITDCDDALVIEGEEVFRLHGRTKDGQLVVDFDLRAEDGTRIAKIGSNHVVHLAVGYTPRSGPGWSDVVEESTGRVVARVTAPFIDAVRMVGTCNVKGYHVEITEVGLVAGGSIITKNTIRGFKKAIALQRGSVMIGLR